MNSGWEKPVKKTKPRPSTSATNAALRTSLRSVVFSPVTAAVVIPSSLAAPPAARIPARGGRSPDSRTFAPTAFPTHRQWLRGWSWPLTVAGAAPALGFGPSPAFPLGACKSAPPRASNSLGVPPVSNRSVDAERTIQMTGERDESARHKAKMANRKAVQDKEVAGKTVEKGLLIVHTGKGK